MAMKKGKFYGVGIGPGDPELLTLKAKRILEECSVIATPQTAGGKTLALDIASQAVNMEGKTIVELYFAMARDKSKQQAAHEQAVSDIEKFLMQGQDVAMLNLGDVSIFATYSYLMDIFKSKGYETVMIPGVPSFCAVAAGLSVSLTTMNEPLHIIPASGTDLDEALELRGSKILMKAGSQMPEVLDKLRAHGKIENSGMIINCGLPEEEVYPDLSKSAPGQGAGYFATIVVKEGK